ncbi:hypothetical protein [Achromobacter sp.]|nr:hypothetical protein [Achromobacter sp.]
MTLFLVDLMFLHPLVVPRLLPALNAGIRPSHSLTADTVMA